MIKYTAVITTLLILSPRYAYSDGRINVRVDFSRTNIQGAYNNVGLDWQGFEIELENEFKKSKVGLSGFSFGVRRELVYGFTGSGTTNDVHKWDEGTYLVVRMYRNFDFADRKWSIGPSVALLYGIPGTTLDKTIGTVQGNGGSDYTHVFPMRNSDVPKLLAAKADLVTDSAMFYPEVAVSIKRRLAGGGIVFDWLAGVRIIRFGIVDSNSEGAVFSDRRVFVPCVGIRVGFRIF